MSFIRGHELIHVLSPVDMYSNCLHIYIALVSAALRGVGCQGGSSSRKFLGVCHSLISIHWFFFNKAYFNTLDIFMHWLLSRVQSIKSLEGSALVLRVVFCLRRFWRGFRGFRRIFPDHSCSRFIACAVLST